MPSFKTSSHLSISFPCPLKMTLSQTYASAFLFLPNSRLRYLIMCFKYLVINLFSVFLVFDWKFHVSRDTVLFISALGGTRAKLNKHLLKIWLTEPGKSPHCVVWCHFWLWPSTSTGSSILGTAILQPSHPFHTAPLQPSTLSYFLCPPFPKGQILLFIFQKKLKQLNDESHGFRPSPVSKPPGPLPVLSAFLWTHPLLHPQEQDLCTVWSSTSLSLSLSFHFLTSQLHFTALYWFSFYLPDPSSQCLLEISISFWGIPTTSSICWWLPSPYLQPWVPWTSTCGRPASILGLHCLRGNFLCTGPSLLPTQLFLCVPWLSEKSHITQFPKPETWNCTWLPSHYLISLYTCHVLWIIPAKSSQIHLCLCSVTIQREANMSCHE